MAGTHICKETHLESNQNCTESGSDDNIEIGPKETARF
jgi:hypothetical protein